MKEPLTNLNIQKKKKMVAFRSIRDKGRREKHLSLST
jgi:hypothetical protein